MVGVPGRSNGCHTCLKRRLKCDEAKPTCYRCKKSGYVCKGYGKTLKVRFYAFKGTSKISGSDVTDDAQNLQANSGCNASAHGANRSTKHNVVPRDVSLIAFKEEIQYSFLFSNLVWSHYGSPWLHQSALGKLGVLALEACQAFSYSMFGQHHHLLDVEVDGSRHYSSALHKLSSRLSTVGAPDSADLIVPIMILLLYSSTGSNAQASAFHIQALSKLLQICGPEAFAKEPLRGVFESCRATLITVALITKTRTFLEDDTWTLGPWSSNSSKTCHTELVDVLAHVPGFLHDQQELSNLDKDFMREDLVCRIKSQLSAAYAWRYRWELLNPAAGQDMGHDTEHPLMGLLRSWPFAKVLVCSSWKQATEIALYNAVVLCLLSILWSLELPMKEVTSVGRKSQSPLLLPNQISSLEQVAMEICRAFEFQLAAVSHIEGLYLRDADMPIRRINDALSQTPGENVVVRRIWLRLWPAPLFSDFLPPCTTLA